MHARRGTLADWTFDADIARAQTIPSWLYTDAAVLPVEMERIFARTWQVVAHRDQLRETGAYSRSGEKSLVMVFFRERDLASCGIRRQAVYRSCESWSIDSSLRSSPIRLRIVGSGARGRLRLRATANAVLFALACLGFSPARDSLAQDAACQRPAPKQVVPGEVVVLGAPSPLPCRIALRETPVRLIVDERGEVADIRGRVGAAANGGYLTNTGTAQVSVWRPDGTFLRNVGRGGQGPGEFATSVTELYSTAAAGLIVRDNGSRWSLFSPTYEFVRHFTAVGMGYAARFSAFVEPLTFLTAQTVAGDTVFFKVFDFSGADSVSRLSPPTAVEAFRPRFVRGFGPIPLADRRVPRNNLWRLVSHTGGKTFWAGPPASIGRGYELELWTIDGVRLRTLRRTVSWYPAGTDRAAPSVEGGAAVRPASSIAYVHHDGNGLLFVMAVVVADRWRAVSTGDPAARARMDTESRDVYYEVIDAEAGVVLASTGPIREGEGELYGAFFQAGTRMGFRRMENAGGLPYMQGVEYRLLRR